MRSARPRSSAGIQRFGLINALAQGTDYRALVCVFLAGGNDGNNLVVPTSSTEYSAYSAVRSASGLAIPSDSLLPIAPASINSPFGLHPSLAELHALWSQQKLSVVCNAGPLVQPLNREQYQGGAPRPYQLFSHSDQVAQWQTSIADRIASDRMGRSHGRPVSRHRFRRPDDHRAVRRPLHARADPPRRSRSPPPRRRSIRCWS